MDHETLLKFIKESGYKTKAEILNKFPEDKETLLMYLKFLVDKRIIGQIHYESPPEIGEISGEIFYVIDRS